MKKSIALALILSLPIVLIAEEKKVLDVSSLDELFKNGLVSGELRAMYGSYDIKNSQNIYATALGGELKYETARLFGFSAAAAFRTSYDIRALSGKNDNHNPELSSNDRDFTMLSDAYVNYNYDALNIKVGRQSLETPLADSDDIRMIPNRFEAYVASYELESINFIAGKIVKWQGYDAGLEDRWQKTGEHGTYFGGINFSNDNIKANAWYYNIKDMINAYYVDTTLSKDIGDVSLSGSLQYLRENELNRSGIANSIYGALAEVSTHGLTINIAYNKAKRKKDKESFSGFGGGTLFTSMDTMILDDIATDREARALVGGISYEINDNLSLSYAYGDFKGKADGNGDKAHITEHNIVAEYNFAKSDVSLRAIYAKEKNRLNSSDSDTNWNRFELMASYKF